MLKFLFLIPLIYFLSFISVHAQDTPFKIELGGGIMIPQEISLKSGPNIRTSIDLRVHKDFYCFFEGSYWFSNSTLSNLGNYGVNDIEAYINNFAIGTGVKYDKPNSFIFQAGIFYNNSLSP